MKTVDFKSTAIIYTVYENETITNTIAYLILYCISDKHSYYLSIKDCNQLAKNLDILSKQVKSFSTTMQTQASLGVMNSGTGVTAKREEGKNKNWKYSIHDGVYFDENECDRLQNSLVTAIATMRALKNPQTRIAAYNSGKGE